MGWSSKYDKRILEVTIGLLGASIGDPSGQMEQYFTNLDDPWNKGEFSSKKLHFEVVWSRYNFLPDPYKYPDAQRKVCLPIHVGNAWGKCRPIHYTLRIWDMVKFLT